MRLVRHDYSNSEAVASSDPKTIGVSVTAVELVGEPDQPGSDFARASPLETAQFAARRPLSIIGQ